jgi:hypothetical protein
MFFFLPLLIIIACFIKYKYQNKLSIEKNSIKINESTQNITTNNKTENEEFQNNNTNRKENKIQNKSSHQNSFKLKIIDHARTEKQETLHTKPINRAIMSINSKEINKPIDSSNNFLLIPSMNSTTFTASTITSTTNAHSHHPHHQFNHHSNRRESFLYRSDNDFDNLVMNKKSIRSVSISSEQ